MCKADMRGEEADMTIVKKSWWLMVKGLSRVFEVAARLLFACAIGGRLSQQRVQVVVRAIEGDGWLQKAACEEPLGYMTFRKSFNHRRARLGLRTLIGLS